jgi:hypothetical protein
MSLNLIAESCAVLDSSEGEGGINRARMPFAIH